MSTARLEGPGRRGSLPARVRGGAPIVPRHWGLCRTFGRSAGEQAPGGRLCRNADNAGHDRYPRRGTTEVAITAVLASDLMATIVTHSPANAAALVNHPSVDVFTLGGRLLKQAGSVCGAATAEAAAKVSADLFLLGVAGHPPKEGFTAVDSDSAAMERILVSRAAETYVLGSAEKLGTVAAYGVVGISEVSGVITDAPEDHATVKQLRKRGVHIIHAP